MGTFFFFFIFQLTMFILLKPSIIVYFHSGWNQFDFFVVCTSVLDLLLEFAGGNTVSFLKVGP